MDAAIFYLAMKKKTVLWGLYRSDYTQYICAVGRTFDNVTNPSLPNFQILHFLWLLVGLLNINWCSDKH